MEIITDLRQFTECKRAQSHGREKWNPNIHHVIPFCLLSIRIEKRFKHPKKEMDGACRALLLPTTPLHALEPGLLRSLSLHVRQRLSSSQSRDATLSQVCVLLKRIWEAVVAVATTTTTTTPSSSSRTLLEYSFEMVSVVFRSLPFIDLEDEHAGASSISIVSSSMESYVTWISFLQSPSYLSLMDPIAMIEQQQQQHQRSSASIPLHALISAFCISNYLGRYALLLKRRAVVAGNVNSDVHLGTCQKFETEILRLIARTIPFTSLSPLAVIALHFISIFQEELTRDPIHNLIPLTSINTFMTQYLSIRDFPALDFHGNEMLLLDTDMVEGWRQACLSCSSINDYTDSKNILSLLEPSNLARDFLFIDFVFTEKSSFYIVKSHTHGFLLAKRGPTNTTTNTDYNNLHNHRQHYTLFHSVCTQFNFVQHQQQHHNYRHKGKSNLLSFQGRIITRTSLLQDAFSGDQGPVCCRQASYEGISSWSSLESPVIIPHRLLSACNIDSSAPASSGFLFNSINYFIEDVIDIVQKLESAASKLHNLVLCTRGYFKGLGRRIGVHRMLQSIHPDLWPTLRSQHNESVGGKTAFSSIVREMVIACSSLSAASTPATASSSSLSTLLPWQMHMLHLNLGDLNAFLIFSMSTTLTATTTTITNDVSTDLLGFLLAIEAMLVEPHSSSYESSIQKMCKIFIKQDWKEVKEEEEEERGLLGLKLLKTAFPVGY